MQSSTTLFHMPELLFPATYYREHLATSSATLQQSEQRLSWYSNARLISFGIGLLLSLLAAAWSGVASLIVAVLSLVVFGLLVAQYRQAFTQAEASRALVQFFESGLARIEDRWSQAEPPAWEVSDKHPYSADLDLFGKGSLFQLLYLGWTPMGNRTLTGWLLEPADRSIVLSRQQAVQELVPLSTQREEAAVRAVGLHAFEEAHLREWVTQPACEFPRWERTVTDVLIVTNAAVLAAWIGGYLSGWFALTSVAAMLLWSNRLAARTTNSLRGLNRQADRLLSLSVLLRQVEEYPYTAPLLQQIQSEWKSGKRASAAIEELAQLAERLDWPRNAFFLPVALLMLWWNRLAFQVADWHAASGVHVLRWLDALGQWEALQCLATLSYEHPDYIFPVILESGKSFEAEQLGHPLLPSVKCRCNDVSLGISHQLLLISGSNMSGKSTLLRTVGINVVLALAGGPVKAKSLRLTELYPGATLRVQDSLQSGISRFYAEILRLRQLLDLAQEKPLLFLVDEVLSGTNSAERRQGAAGILQALLQRGAIGLATTHDLALTEIAEQWKPQSVNMHFEDTWKDEQISFDYQLRPGVVSQGNALALMRAVGLDVK